MKSEALLVGRIFDDRGNRMSPSHARKGGIKYRYYLSSALLQGQAERAGSIRRVPAAEIEALVVKSVREHLKPSIPIDDRSLINTHVARVEVQPEQLVIQLAQAPKSQSQERQQGATPSVSRGTRHPRRAAVRFLCLTASSPNRLARSVRRPAPPWSHRSRADGAGSTSLSSDAKASVESIAKRERCSVRQVNMTISLAFLAPDLVKAAIEGRLPRGIGVTRLRDAPVEWSRQQAMLGLAG